MSTTKSQLTAEQPSIKKKTGTYPPPKIFYSTSNDIKKKPYGRRGTFSV